MASATTLLKLSAIVLCLLCQHFQTDAFILANLEEITQEQKDTAGIQEEIPVQDPLPGEERKQDVDEDDGTVGGVGYNRTKRDIDCGPSPEGVTEPCLVCDGREAVLYTDINGLSCRCGVCRPPKYMRVPCICTPDGKVESGPVCSLPKHGEEYMDVSNWCDRPKKCSKCKGNLEVKVNCTAYEDTTCDCPRDMYRTSEIECEPIPPCQKDFEIHVIPQRDSIYNTYECRACEPGFTQPNDNSLGRCRPVEKNDLVTYLPVTADNDTNRGSKTAETTDPEPLPIGGVTTGPSPTITPRPEQSNVNCSLSCPSTTSSQTLQHITTENPEDNVNRQFKCNDTTNIDDINWSLNLHPGMLFLVITTWVISMALVTFLSLVYGIKNPERVALLMTKLRVPQRVYTSPDLPCRTNLGTNTESTESLADVAIDADTNVSNSEMQRLTSGGLDDDATRGYSHSRKTDTSPHRVYDEEDAKGGSRGKSQKKFVRERSKIEAVKDQQ